MLYEVLPDPRALPAVSGAGEREVLQFHRSLPDPVPVGHFEPGGIAIVDELVARSVYLDWIQQACARLGDRLEIRFFGHYDEVFDASVLDHLDQIRHLSIDSLMHVTNAEAVKRLPFLVSLRFGPHKIESGKILSVLGLERLTHFTLASSPTPIIDLSPLAAANKLETLRILGSGKNMDSIGNLTALTELALQPSSKSPLHFVNALSALRVLKLVLGSSETINAVESLPYLHDLSILQVRYLSDIGDLQRFPRLQRLQVSDQPRLTAVQLGARNEALEHLYLYSVPALQALRGFAMLPTIKSLFVYDSRLNLPLVQLPQSLTHFRLMTKAMKGRDAHEAAVRAQGLTPDVHPDATFFYK